MARPRRTDSILTFMEKASIPMTYKSQIENYFNKQRDFIIDIDEISIQNVFFLIVVGIPPKSIDAFFQEGFTERNLNYIRSKFSQLKFRNSYLHDIKLPKKVPKDSDFSTVLLKDLCTKESNMDIDRRKKRMDQFQGLLAKYKTDPENVNVANQLAKALFSLGDFSGAQTVIERIIASSDNLHDALILKIKLLEREIAVLTDSAMHQAIAAEDIENFSTTEVMQNMVLGKISEINKKQDEILSNRLKLYTHHKKNGLISMWNDTHKDNVDEICKKLKSPFLLSEAKNTDLQEFIEDTLLLNHLFPLGGTFISNIPNFLLSLSESHPDLLNKYGLSMLTSLKAEIETRPYLISWMHSNKIWRLLDVMDLTYEEKEGFLNEMSVQIEKSIAYTNLSLYMEVFNKIVNESGFKAALNDFTRYCDENAIHSEIVKYFAESFLETTLSNVFSAWKYFQPGDSDDSNENYDNSIECEQEETGSSLKYIFNPRLAIEKIKLNRLSVLEELSIFYSTFPETVQRCLKSTGSGVIMELEGFEFFPNGGVYENLIVYFEEIMRTNTNTTSMDLFIWLNDQVAVQDHY